MTLNLIHRKFKKKENNIYLSYFYLFIKIFLFLLDKIFKIWLIILEIINI
jgi:hypothetical protein